MSNAAHKSSRYLRTDLFPKREVLSGTREVVVCILLLGEVESGNDGVEYILLEVLADVVGCLLNLEVLIEKLYGFLYSIQHGVLVLEVMRLEVRTHVTESVCNNVLHPTRVAD